MTAQLISMKREISHAYGWVGEMIYHMPQSEVDAWIAANYAASYPGTAFLTPTKISDDAIEGCKVQQSGMTDWRKVTVSFASDYLNVNWPCGLTRPSYCAGTTLKMSMRFSGQYLTLPAKAVKVEKTSPSDPEPPRPSEGTANRLFIPLIDYQVEWDRVPAAWFDVQKFRATYAGKTNATEFMGAPAECLLFEGATADPSFRLNPTEPHTWRVVVTLKERQIQVGENVYGWNHDYIDNPPGWRRSLLEDRSSPSSSGSSDPSKYRYPLVDFSKMFACTCGSSSSGT